MRRLGGGGEGGRLQAGRGESWDRSCPAASEGPALLRVTSILYSRPPEPGEDTRVLFQPRSWGNSATAALGHSQWISPFLEIWYETSHYLGKPRTKTIGNGWKVYYYDDGYLLFWVLNI